MSKYLIGFAITIAILCGMIVACGKSDGNGVGNTVSFFGAGS